MKLKFTYLFILFLLLNVDVFAQREGAIEYDKEFLVGIDFNTNGGLIGGFMMRYTTRVLESRNQFHNFGLSLGIIKHPKEIRYSSQQSGGTFIAYKANHMVVLRPMYGREFVLFHKGNEDGVQLDFIFNGGLSFGLLTPYYIEYQGPNGPEITAYNSVTTPDVNKVLNSQGYGTGFSESNLVMGINLKTGFSFEYGHYTNKVTGLEVGFLFEAFTKTMVMMEAPAGSGGSIHNNQVFSSVYINIFYGGRK
jgi:hypothetical protein